MERIRDKIERWIRSDEGAFEPLALELFAYQFENNLAYKAYCQSQAVTPEKVRAWQDIPAVPMRAFKSAELATFPVGRSAAIFESSGTTGKAPSRHYLKTLTFYEMSLKASFEKWVMQASATKSMPFLILTPSPAEAPRSSLSWMMDVVKRRWGAPGSQYIVRNGRLDELWLATFLRKSVAIGEPVALMGTTLAFQSFLDYCSRSGHHFTLPKESLLMDTGGMKGQLREISRPDFVRQVGEFLGVPEALCINEYGMCEMSSQFYGKGVASVLQGPAWVRTLVVDASTGAEVPAGQVGLLRHYDLANVDSVLAIQTEDLGIVPSPRAGAGPLPTGEGTERLGEGFILLGRAPEADLKGCSLAAEAFLK